MKKTKTRVSLTLLAVILLASLVSCSPFPLGLAGNAWLGHETHDVTGRMGLLIKQKIRFAEYQTLNVKRSWTRGSNGYSGLGFGTFGAGQYVNLIGREYIDRKQTIRFDLSDGGNRGSTVFAVSQFQASNLLLGNNRGLLSIGIDLLEFKGGNFSNLFFAQIYTPDSEEPWQLVLNNDRAQRFPKECAGTIAKSSGDYYTIFPVSTLQNSEGKIMYMPFGSIGFEIRNSSGRPLAAVNISEGGQVHFPKNLDPEVRFLMANICTALLLQEVIG